MKRKKENKKQNGLDTFYLMITNRNLQQEIAEHIRAEGLLHYRIEFEKLIASLSSDFIKLSSDEIPPEAWKEKNISTCAIRN